MQFPGVNTNSKAPHPTPKKASITSERYQVAYLSSRLSDLVGLFIQSLCFLLTPDCPGIMLLYYMLLQQLQ